MKLEKGKQYECIEDVKGGVSNRLYYKKGSVYTCEKKGCLTDEDGCMVHSWDESKAKLHFKPYDTQPKTGERVLVWDEYKDDAEEFIFFTKVDGDFPYVVFGEDFNYDEFKTGHVFKCLSFKNMKPLPKVETITKSEALKLLKEIRGVEVKIEG